MADLQVQKKDGQLESFDLGKVKMGLQKAGASTDQIESIAVQINNWAGQVAKDGVVKAVDIRAEVLAQLDESNPEAAAKFREYRKGA